MAADITVTSQITQHGTQFEKKHVQHVYDEIATSMNELRHKAWPNVKRFLKNFPPSSLIADIGCGNGRYLCINKSTYKIGLDVCTALVNDARNKGHEVAYGDNLQIPFRDGCFDGVVSIGVIHHFCSNERRISATKELTRILRPGGRMMLYVWAYEQNHRKFESQDVLIPWHGLYKGRQQRIGSASSIQSYGQSSTSSVSEDEITDKSVDTNTSNTSSPTVLRRQNSLSADDLTALQDLSDFKPSYYSLDFNGSPHNAKKNTENDTKYVWNKNGAKLYHSSSGTNKLISECRKLEASLRAMSAGNLEDLEKDEKLTLEIADDTDHYNNVNFAKNHSEDFSSDIIENPSLQSDVEITLDWNIDMLENDDFETAIPNVTGLSENCSQDRSDNSYDDMKYNNNNSMKNMHQDSFDSGHESLKTSFTHPKLNPFLKDFSSSFEEVECFNFSPDIPKNSDNFPDVNVEFKLPRKKNIANNQKSETSFFGAVKSKLLELFDDETKRTSDNSVRKSNPGTCSKNSNILNSIGHKSYNRQLSSELSMEQLDLAAKLNFRVREFPLSSCPDVVSDGQSSHGSDQSGSSIHSSLFNESANQCSCNILSKEYCEHCKSTFKCNPMNTIDAKDTIIEEKCQNEKENDVLQHIYDGYFKIEISQSSDRKEQANFMDLQKGALKSHTHVKNGCSIPQYTKDSIKISKENISMSKYQQNDNYSVLNKQCNMNVNNSQRCANSSQNYQNVENDQLSTDKNNKIQNNREDSLPIKNSNSKEDDSVFDTTEESFTSKLCRYYHVFREGEVENMISTHISDLQIIQCVYDHGNWCVIAEKL